MEKILYSIFERFGAAEAVNFVISYCNMRAVRGLAESVQELPVDLKNRLAEEVIKRGNPHDAYYFLQLVKGIPESMKDRLLDKAGIHDKDVRQVVRTPMV